MIVLKFGGTSLGSFSSLKTSLTVIKNHIMSGQKVGIVVSAFGGMTNFLLNSIKRIEQGHTPISQLLAFKGHHDNVLQPFPDNLKTIINKRVEAIYEKLLFSYNMISKNISCSTDSYCSILSAGELISAEIMHSLLEFDRVNTCLLPATAMILASGSRLEADPLLQEVRYNFQHALASSYRCFLMAGFIASNSKSELCLLGRNSSDYSGSLMSYGFSASDYEIWTDVDGLFDKNPKEHPDALWIPNLSFDEACSDHFLTAKVIHPKTLPILKETGTVVWIKNTFNPVFVGTKITPFSLSTSPNQRSFVTLN